MCSDTVLRILFFLVVVGHEGKNHMDWSKWEEKQKQEPPIATHRDKTETVSIKRNNVETSASLFGTSIYKQDLVQWAPLFLGISNPTCNTK